MKTLPEQTDSPLGIIRIRPATLEDTENMMALAQAIGLFQPEDLVTFKNRFIDALKGSLGKDHIWITLNTPHLEGAAYYAPEIMAEGTWNLYFIGVHPNAQGKGFGKALLNHVEQSLIKDHQRLLLVETSGEDSFEATRKFYSQNGYELEARIRDFYEPGNDKIIYRKALGGR
ncbi:MAG: GNAT family N-acetyltransferase [Cyanobacteria bacterium]|nr:GNAT family N-acetyltransferase [Cyanobacteriota bacterium]